MTRADTFVSVVAPLHNDGSIVADFIREVHACLEGLYTNFEIVLVDDASDDDTVALVSTLLTQLKCLRLMRLSRHMGDETAIVAGLESAIGDYVLTMIPDTDPPAEIEDMVETARVNKRIKPNANPAAPRPEEAGRRRAVAARGGVAPPFGEHPAADRSSRSRAPRLRR